MGGPLISGIPYGSTNVYIHTPRNLAQLSAISTTFSFFKNPSPFFKNSSIVAEPDSHFHLALRFCSFIPCVTFTKSILCYDHHSSCYPRSLFVRQLLRALPIRPASAGFPAHRVSWEFFKLAHSVFAQGLARPRFKFPEKLSPQTRAASASLRRR